MNKIAICIPTYNRGPDLKNLLDRIWVIGKRFMDMGLLEVCISDNASSDDTGAVVAAFRQKAKNLKYSVNPENLGFGKNLRKVIEMASCDYCWLMGSDDLPTEQSFELLFNAVNKSPDIIIGNVISNGKLHKFIAKDGDSVFYFGGGHRISDYLNLCNEVSAAFAFISSIVVRKGFWNFQEATSYEETHPYTHMVQICKNIAFNKSTLIYLDAPIVSHGFENKNEYNQSALPHFELDLSTFDYISRVFFGSAGDVVEAYGRIVKKNFNTIRILKSRIEATNEQWLRLSDILIGYGYKKSFVCKKKYDVFLKHIFDFSKVLRACRVYFWE